MNRSKSSSFTRTGTTWAVLALAACAWIATSVWAYRTVNPDTATPEQDSQTLARSQQHNSSEAESQKSLESAQLAEQKEAEQARVAAEEARLAAEEAEQLADLTG